MPSDRELLERLFNLLVRRNFIIGDEASTRDMVKRYQRPPVTMHNRVAMQMTIPEYKALGDLLAEIDKHLNPAAAAEEETRESA